MHYRFLVTFNTEHAKNSAEAREHVFTTLQDEGFCASGRFTAAFADWFVVGGRWSGELTKALLPRETLLAVEKEFEEKHGWWVGGKEGATREQRREEMSTIFMRHVPGFTGEVPYWRDTYKPDGYEDDAMVLTQALFDRLLKDYHGDLSEEHVDLDYDDVSPEMVGEKWLVVVDYHN